MGKHGEARAILKQALSDAAKDNMVMPFVENFIYLEPLFEGTMPEIEEGFLKTVKIWEMKRLIRNSLNVLHNRN